MVKENLLGSRTRNLLDNAKKSVRTTVYLEGNNYSDLKILSKATGKSISEIINTIIADIVEEYRDTIENHRSEYDKK